MNDLPLFNPPAQAHSETSVAAGEKIKLNANSLRMRVLWFLKTKAEYGATDEEMQVGLRMDPSTQRPRRIELVRAGLVSDSGKTRDTAAGRKATVWTVN